MAEAVWQGLLTGLVLSTFIGPIFFAVVDLGLKDNLKGAAYMAFGTFISDGLTVTLIYLVAKQVDQGSMLLQIMYVAGGLVLVLIGLNNLLRSKMNDTSVKMNSKDLWSLFVKGFLINSTNPNVFFFWFGAVMVAVHRYDNSGQLVLTHFFSALILVFSTDFLKGYAASLLRTRVSHRVLGYLGRISGTVLIYFGIKLMFFH